MTRRSAFIGWLAGGVFSCAMAGATADAVPIAEPPVPIGPPAMEYAGGPAEGPSAEVPEPLTPAPEPGYPIGAVDFDRNAVNTGFYNIPPDPIGAASMTHLVNVVNTSIEWYRRSDGLRQNTQLLGYSSTRPPGFFASLSPANLTFDPKVVYDQYEGRFVVVTLEKVESGSNSDAGNTSRILVAVSANGDPNGTLSYQALNGKVTVGTGASAVDYWADYPGLAVDEDAIYITANMFAFAPVSGSAGQRLWIVPKGVGTGGLYSGGSSTVTIRNATGNYGTTKQPAHVFGEGVPPGTGTTANPGTLLVGYSGLSGGGTEYLHFILVDDPLGQQGGPFLSLESIRAVGDIDNTDVGMPDAPQSGGPAMIKTNDREP